VKISEALQGVGRLYIDTAPFIYYTESRPASVDRMRSIFRPVLSGRLSVVASTIILTECLSKPMKEGDSALVTAYNTLFRHTRGISLIPVHVTVAGRAADLRARYALRTPDALHVATALVSGSDAFLTNDLDLKRVREIRVLVLDELELDIP